MPKTIAYFIPTLKQAGTSTQALAFCDTMHEDGHEVTLVVAKHEGDFTSAAAKRPYKILYLHKSKYLKRLFNIMYLTIYIRKHKPDTILSGAKGVNKQAIWSNMFSRQSTRLILILTNELLQRTAPEDKGRLFSKRIHMWMYKLADHTIVLTKAMRSTLIASGFKASDITVIAPPINIDEIKSKSLTPIDHPWLLTPKTERKIPVILAVGRLSVQKNYPALLKALAHTQKTRPVRLIIIGSGTKKYTTKLKALVRKYNLFELVDFIGFSDNPYKYMHNANVFALTSHWEGFGIVLSEALACGTTIVSTDCPDGPREILGNGNFGYLCSQHDTPALANMLLRAINTPLKPDILVTRAAQYNSANIRAQYLTLLTNNPSAEVVSNTPK